MNHVFEKHENCQRQQCMICDGGLSVCTTCKCIEGSLATHCPGFDCYATHGDRIYSGEIDFVDGKWVPGKGTYRGEHDEHNALDRR